MEKNQYAINFQRGIVESMDRERQAAASLLSHLAKKKYFAQEHDVYSFALTQNT